MSSQNATRPTQKGTTVQRMRAEVHDCCKLTRPNALCSAPSSISLACTYRCSFYMQLLLLKRYTAHRRKRQYTLCSVAGKHDIGITITTAHPGYFIEYYGEPNKFWAEHTKPCIVKCAIVVASSDAFSSILRLCPLQKVSVSLKLLMSGLALAVAENEAASCTSSCRVFSLPPNTITTAPSPERHPGAASEDYHLVCPQTSSLLFSSSLHSFFTPLFSPIRISGHILCSFSQVSGLQHLHLASSRLTWSSFGVTTGPAHCKSLLFTTR